MGCEVCGAPTSRRVCKQCELAERYSRRMGSEPEESTDASDDREREDDAEAEP